MIRRQIGRITDRIRALRRKLIPLKRARWKIAQINSRGGAFGNLIYEERGALDLATAVALVEQESGFRNVFGCDFGAVGDQPPYCQQTVTERRAKAFLGWVRRTGSGNGVGPVQITAPAFIERAASRPGGIADARNTMRVGFAVLNGLVRQGHGLRWALAAYNGGPGNPQWDYADQVLARRERWNGILN